MTIAPESTAPTADHLAQRTVQKLQKHVGHHWRYDSDHELFLLEDVSPAVRDLLAAKLGEQGYAHQIFIDERAEVRKLAMDQAQADHAIGLACIRGHGMDRRSAITTMYNDQWQKTVHERAPATTPISRR